MCMCVPMVSAQLSVLTSIQKEEAMADQDFLVAM